MKSRKLILLSGLFAWLQTGLFAQTGTLKGVVRDAETKESIIGANVVNYSNRSTGASTDIDGKFEFTLPAGKQKVICTFTGMESDTIPVEIKIGEPTEIAILMKSVAKELGMVVVSAGRFEQKYEDITVSMNVIKPTMVENKNTTSVDKALEQTPGVVILDSEPQIRGGSGFNFGVGSRVAVLVDDLPLLSGDAGKPEWSFIPVENLEQIEVIKGASSVLYGSSALSGVINIRMAYPKDKPLTKVNLYSGVYSIPDPAHADWRNGESPMYYGANFFHSRKIKQFDLVLGGNLLHDPGFIGPPPYDPKAIPKQDSLTNDDVATRRARMNFNLRYRPKKFTGLTYGVNGNYMQSTTNFSLVWLNADTGIYRAYPGTMTTTDLTIWHLDPFLTLHTKGGGRHSVKTRLFYTDNNNNNNQANESTIYYGEYQFQKKYDFIKDLIIATGMMGSKTDAQSEIYVGGDSTGRNISRNYAFYSQFDKKFWESINLSLGVRYEVFRINNDQAVEKPIYRGGLSYQVGKATFVRYSYGQGYRFPTIAEKYIRTSTGGMGVYPNENILPENSWNMEVGVKQGIKIGSFMGYADIAGFWQQYENTMEFVMARWERSAFLPGFKFVNTGTTRVRGFDFSVLGQGKLTSHIGLNIIAGYTYTKPESLSPNEVFAVDSNFIPRKLSYVSTSSDTTDYILKYRSQHLGKVDLELTWKGLAVGASYRYYSRVQNLDNIMLYLDTVPEGSPILPTGITKYREENTGGISVYDARISYMYSERFKLAFVMNNILNTQYSLRPLKIEAPRTTAIQLTVKI